MTTVYPQAIDTNSNFTTVNDNITPIRAAIIQELRETIIAVESELGAKPSGTYTTVKLRLSAIEDVITSLIISGGASSTPIGPAGGHLNGFYPDPIVQNFSLVGELNNTIAYFDSGATQWKAKLLTNNNVDPAAAIDGTKINPNFGSQDITTTGTISGTFSSLGEVANIAALKALIAPAANTKIFVKGYYSINDGGQGDFYWDAFSIETDNGGTIIEPNIAGTGRWIRIYSGAINVKWFGATGDGITDDIIFIQSAIDAAALLSSPREKNKVFFPPENNYKITSSVLMKSNIYLDISNSIIICATDFHAIDCINVGNFSITNGSFKGGGSTSVPSAQKACVHINLGTNFIIDNITAVRYDSAGINYGFDYAIWAQMCSFGEITNIIFEGGDFQSNGDGIPINNSHNIIINNIIGIDYRKTMVYAGGAPGDSPPWSSPGWTIANSIDNPEISISPLLKIRAPLQVTITAATDLVATHFDMMVAGLSESAIFITENYINVDSTQAAGAYWTALTSSSILFNITKLSNSRPVNGIYQQQNRHFTISNINGRGWSDGDGYTTGIAIREASGFEISNVSIEQCGSGGIFIQSESTEPNTFIEDGNISNIVIRNSRGCGFHLTGVNRAGSIRNISGNNINVAGSGTIISDPGIRINNVSGGAWSNLESINASGPQGILFGAASNVTAAALRTDNCNQVGLQLSNCTRLILSGLLIKDSSMGGGNYNDIYIVSGTQIMLNEWSTYASSAQALYAMYIDGASVDVKAGWGMAIGTQNPFVNNNGTFTAGADEIWFGAQSISWGTAVPIFTRPEGSLYMRTGGSNGALYVRENSIWVLNASTASGIITTTITTGVTDGYCGYMSSANTVSKTDATSITSSRFFGVNEGTVGVMTTSGTVDAVKFTTTGGTPSIGAPVYLAPGTEEASATGKLTATKPTTPGQVVAEVGIVMDNANYAGSKTAKILLQVKAPIQL